MLIDSGCHLQWWIAQGKRGKQNSKFAFSSVRKTIRSSTSNRSDPSNANFAYHCIMTAASIIAIYILYVYSTFISSAYSHTYIYVCIYINIFIDVCKYKYIYIYIGKHKKGEKSWILLVFSTRFRVMCI